MLLVNNMFRIPTKVFEPMIKMSHYKTAQLLCCRYTWFYCHRNTRKPIQFNYLTAVLWLVRHIERHLRHPWFRNKHFQKFCMFTYKNCTYNKTLTDPIRSTTSTRLVRQTTGITLWAGTGGNLEGYRVPIGFGFTE